MPTKRTLCSQCERPPARCLCGFICPTANQVAVLILQHPEESSRAKNTAALLQRSLNNSQLVLGEEFDQLQLHELMYADQRQPLLLYPEQADYSSLGIAAPPRAHSLNQYNPGQLRLVVLDGTWRKSRKMLYLNPMLQKLPRVNLQTLPKSKYHIRKAHHENQLSTLEASCYALQQLEQDQATYTPLLEAMDQFVAQLAAFAPTHAPNKRQPPL